MIFRIAIENTYGTRPVLLPGGWPVEDDLFWEAWYSLKYKHIFIGAWVRFN